MQSTNIDRLNSLLRGELAATETYQQAMTKLANDPHAAELRKLHAEHRAAANTLRQHVHGHSGTPDQSSGVWGGWAKLFEGTAALFGESAALKALKEGEEHGLKDYETALQDKTMAPECMDLIRNELLPQTRQHVAALGRMISSIA
jgi:uncharacterized protein (TIGR02284 family)